MAAENPAQIYEDFLVPGIHARWTPLFLNHADPRPGEDVLDLACGTGIVARNVASAVGEEGSLTAVDVSPDMLKVAREIAPSEDADVVWRQCQAESLPLDDDSFDLVLCQQGFQFFEDRKAASLEMRRVLRPDGRAVVSVWQGLRRHPVYDALCRAEARYLDVPVERLATPFRLANSDDLERPLEEAGFESVDVEQESHDVLFPASDRFVALTVLAAASIIPESDMDEPARQQLVATVGEAVHPMLDRYRDGDAITFPMHAHIALARS